MKSLLSNPSFLEMSDSKVFQWDIDADDVLIVKRKENGFIIPSFLFVANVIDFVQDKHYVDFKVEGVSIEKIEALDGTLNFSIQVVSREKNADEIELLLYVRSEKKEKWKSYAKATLVNENVENLSNPIYENNLDTSKSLSHNIADNQKDKKVFVRFEDFDAIRPSYLVLTDTQERMWFLQKLTEDANSVCHMSICFKLSAPPQRDIFEQSLALVINNHEALHTIFTDDPSHGTYQKLAPVSSFKIETILVAEGSSLDKTISCCCSEPFVLEREIPIKAYLIETQSKDYYFTVVIHNIACDDHSIEIVVEDFIHCYSLLCLGKKVNLLPPEKQYLDYALWLNQQMDTEYYDKSLDYWKQKLSGVQPLELSYDYLRSAIQSNKGKRLAFTLNKTQRDTLVAYSSDKKSTLFMVLLALFKLLMYRYSGQTDICVGTPTAGRPHKSMERIVGLFTNTLALRTQVHADMTFDELLEQIKLTTLSAYEHQIIPFDKVVKVSNVKSDVSRNPIFQVLFGLQESRPEQIITVGHMDFEPYNIPSDSTKFDLSFNFYDDKETINLIIEYCSDLFNEETIQRMANQYLGLLEKISSFSNCKLYEIPLLSEFDKDQLLNIFNKTHYVLPTHETVVSLFEKRAKNSANDVATIYDNQQLTYSSLNIQANQLAHYLIESGVTPGQRIGLCLAPSLIMPIAIMAVLKAGALFVPIAPDFPVERMEYILDNADIEILLTTTESQPDINFKNLNCIDIEKHSQLISKMPEDSVSVILEPSMIAYMIYTSGSTGQPKGVPIRHSSLLNLLLSIIETLNINNIDRLLSITTYTFDIFYLELFAPLLLGAQIILVDRSVALNAFSLGDMLTKYKPDIMQATPTSWHMLIEAGIQLPRDMLVLTGGEAISEQLKNTLTRQCDSVWNVYGPTEATIWATAKKLLLDERVTIGRPLHNVQAYVLDKNRQLLPIGMPGELCLSGEGLSEGYWKNHELNENKFIDHPFKSDDKLYRTGDIVRHLSNGEIEYLGRQDDQVKLRGYRIELGDVEYAIAEQNCIRNVYVCLFNKDNRDYLVAYITTADKEFDSALVKQDLEKKLPGYMIPQLWIIVDKFPLTYNQKVDKNRLPEPDITKLLSSQYVAPKTEQEKKLANIFQKVLDVKRVGLEDNYFELGGDSIKTIQISSAARLQGLEISPLEIFQYQTVKKISDNIGENLTSHVSYDLGESDIFSNVFALTPLQNHNYHQFYEKDDFTYNCQYSFNIYLALDLEKIKNLIKTVVERYPAFRTVFFELESGEVVQEVLDSIDIPLKYNDVSHFAPIDKERYIESRYFSNMITDYDLGEGPLFKVELIKLGCEFYRFIFTFNHIVLDGWSLSILSSEFMNAVTEQNDTYISAIEKNSFERYIEYIFCDKNIKKKQGFLWSYLEGFNGQSTLISLLGNQDNFDSYLKKKYQLLNFNKELSDKLRFFCKSNKLTLNTLFLSAWAFTIHSMTHQNDIVFSLKNSGRPPMWGDVNKMSGMYLGLSLLRSNISSDLTISDWLKKIQSDQGLSNSVYGISEDDLMTLTGSNLLDSIYIFQNIPNYDDKENNSDVNYHDIFHQESREFLCVTISDKECISIYINYLYEVFSDEVVGNLLLTIKQYINSVISLDISNSYVLDHLRDISSNDIDDSTKNEKNDGNYFLERFSRSVKSSGDNVAVEDGQSSLTYYQLDQLSTKLAIEIKESDNGYLYSYAYIVTENVIEYSIALVAAIKYGAIPVKMDISSWQEDISKHLELFVGDDQAFILYGNKLSQSIDTIVCKLPRKDAICLLNIETNFEENSVSNVHELDFNDQADAIMFAQWMIPEQDFVNPFIACLISKYIPAFFECEPFPLDGSEVSLVLSNKDRKMLPVLRLLLCFSSAGVVSVSENVKYMTLYKGRDNVSDVIDIDPAWLLDYYAYL